jgi:hypothetical protein
MYEHMIPLAEFDNELDAEIACGHLKSAEIDAIVLKDDAGGMFPSLQGTEGVHLLVPKDREEESRRILEENKGEAS